MYDAFKELHDELMKIGKYNVCFKKKMLKLKNEKDALEKCNNEKIKELELENKILHDKTLAFKGKQSTYEHEKLHVNELMKKNEVLKKKNNELNEIVLKFTNGQKMLENMFNSQKCVFDK